jgi:hypothetical protein
MSVAFYHKLEYTITNLSDAQLTHQCFMPGSWFARWEGCKVGCRSAIRAKVDSD